MIAFVRYECKAVIGDHQEHLNVCIKEIVYKYDARNHASSGHQWPGKVQGPHLIAM
jgi:hypothetical protein